MKSARDRKSALVAELTSVAGQLGEIRRRETRSREELGLSGGGSGAQRQVPEVPAIAHDEQDRDPFMVNLEQRSIHSIVVLDTI